MAPSRLIFFKAEDGYGPLCEFLGVPDPGVPYPRVHNRAKLQGEMFVYRLVTWVWWVVFVPPVALLWFSYKWWAQERSQEKGVVESELAVNKSGRDEECLGFLGGGASFGVRRR
ncbi:hypothetical protein TrLO_g13689 [Triparma laevis f. longispina]|nr:hypothetical protein TrLO_g13689 [Triparma laevis f. longispina]